MYFICTFSAKRFGRHGMKYSLHSFSLYSVTLESWWSWLSATSCTLQLLTNFDLSFYFPNLKLAHSEFHYFPLAFFLRCVFFILNVLNQKLDFRFCIYSLNKISPNIPRIKMNDIFFKTNQYLFSLKRIHSELFR